MSTPQTYLLIDSLNLYFRSRHVVGGNDIDLKIGMSLHIVFNSIRKAWNDFDAQHVVFFQEGRSWRKDVYTPYKANRKTKADQRTPREIQDDQMFLDAFDDLGSFFREHTNVTVIQHPQCEADDLIATWIQTHPDDQHVIISTDSDFYQLLAPNVRQYNGVTEQTITVEGIFDAHGNRVLDKKTGEPKQVPDPQWLLFEKCVRGDSSDNIFSAYPGARIKGSRNKTGIQEAFQDRDRGGYHYNNFMLQRWTDHEGIEHRVREDYERNRMLIDLTAQPDHIKQAAIQAQTQAKQRPRATNVGIHFMKFCGKWSLDRLSQAPADYAEILNARLD